jgi:ABC-2 type transport system permease protein
MKTMKWLVQREFWEHKGSMFWAPIAVATAIVLFIGGTVTYAIGMGRMRGVININGNEAEMSEVVNALTTRHQQALVDTLAGGYLFASAPLYIMMGFTIFFYCLGALYEERRDRSILFWKSLPVSDQQTVLSKLVTAIGIIPLIIIAVAVLASLAILLMACTALAVNGINLFDDIVATPSVYLAPLQLLGMLPVYALWALPTIGWLLMVSAWAKSKVFLWAVGTPVIAIVIVKWAETLFGVDLNADWFIQNVVARGLLGLAPGSWFGFENIEPALVVEGSRRAVDLSRVLAQSWGTLASPGVWIGAIAGAAMIFAAMRLRRWKDEG